LLWITLGWLWKFELGTVEGGWGSIFETNFDFGLGSTGGPKRGIWDTVGGGGAGGSSSSSNGVRIGGWSSWELFEPDGVHPIWLWDF
jgi:hypothetical protein